MFPSPLLDRAALGAVATATVAFAARKAKALTPSGAVAGFTAGTISIAAGWSWGILLLAFFVTATILSKIGDRAKTALLGSVVEKGGERDAWQVAANGGVYVGAALGSIFFGADACYAIGIGALAASTADTWSTEIGTMRGGAPRLIVSGKRVAAGTSGGLTRSGTLGAVAGAILIAIASRLAQWPVPFAAIAAAGIAGALGDSVLGATLQDQRWCEQCRSATERSVHDCGTPTIHKRGLTWLNNDGVNFVSTLIGGLVALLLSGIGSAG